MIRRNTQTEQVAEVPRDPAAALQRWRHLILFVLTLTVIALPLAGEHTLMQVWHRMHTLDEAATGSVETSMSLEITHTLQTVFKPWGKADILVVLALMLGIHGWRRLTSRVFIALILVAAMVTPLKAFIDVERPNGADHRSFPSGDVASLAAVAVPVVVDFPATAPFVTALIIGVSLARVSGGYHHVSDVTAGILIGLLCGCLAMTRRFRTIEMSGRMVASLGVFAIVLFIASRIVWAKSTGYWDTFGAVWGPALLFVGLVLAWKPATLHDQR